MESVKLDYSHIAIIGNGFDLNLGLKTSYTNFVNGNEFKSLLNTDNFLADYLSNKHDLQNWIDVENELKEYSNSQNNLEAINNFENDFVSVSKALKIYLDNISYDNLNKSSYSYQLLEKIKDNDFLLLDFNYTRTTRTILTELGISQMDIEERHIKIHGSVEDGEIIFGIEDGATIKPQHVFLRKAYNQGFKAINVIDNLKNLKELYIIGHSLGETDHMYFKDFFAKQSYEHYYGKGKKITLYHYGHDGYNQLFMQLDDLTDNHLSLFKRNNDFKTIDTSK